MACYHNISVSSDFLFSIFQSNVILKVFYFSEQLVDNVQACMFLFGFGSFVGWIFFPSVSRAMSSAAWLISPCSTPPLVGAAHIDQISLCLSDKEMVEENFLPCF